MTNFNINRGAVKTDVLIPIIGWGAFVLLILSFIVYLINPSLSADPTTKYAVLGALLLGLAGIILTVVVSLKKILEAVKLGSTKYIFNTVIFVIVILGILFVLNFIVYKNPHRFDVTEGNIFTLSDQGAKVLKGIEDEITITGFFTTTDQMDVALKGKLDDLIDSFRPYTGKIIYNVIDPDKDPVSTKANSIASDGPRIIIKYKTKDGREREERVKDPTEEAVINSIMRLTQSAQKKIYFVFGHGEASPEDDGAKGYSFLLKKLESEGYKGEALSLLKTDKVPEDASAVIIAGPDKPMLEPEIKTITDYVMKGGRLLLMIEPFTKPGLDQLLSQLNIIVDDDIVVDPSSRVMGMGVNVPVGMEYTSHAITQNFHLASFFPIARSVREGTEKKEDLVVTPLIRTSQAAWGETSYGDPNSKEEVNITRDDKDFAGPVSLAVAVEKTGIKDPDKYSDKIRVVVFGDRDFASNQFVQNIGNLDLTMNTIAWLAEQENLISIRPKPRKSSRIFLTQQQGNFVNVFSMLVIPFSIIFLGIVIGFTRRRK